MVNADQRPVDVVVLFSGGLDSILAAKVLEEQGLRVCCLHCHSPFFGDPGAVERWSNLYGLDIRTLDVSDDFCAMLRARPAHGFGKVMNPCVDCKILLLRHARLYMESIGARLLATGEVMGQRPMSQRRDVLNAIRRDAGVQDILLRPLSALHLAPTPAEEEGFVDRSRLLGISGRGRKDQLELAKKYQLPEIPMPGGGCRLADKENARRYWPVLSRWPEPDTRAFKLSNLGRQFWAQQDGRDYWLAIGRTSADNQALHTVLGKDDAKIHLADIPGPLAVACGGRTWPEEVLRAAAALMASYSGKAVRLGAPVGVRASWLGGGWQGEVLPSREGIWQEPAWVPAREELRAEQKARLHGIPPQEDEAGE
ncbi:MAG: tRNA(5-methylaminomethyl-2-thiouridylate) methyltransferase [Desulfovibrio sp.]|nr:tRNA(5-methylaminomethyl-2-thiouridylate) methyltransferase [Desulfovibrio sp.]